MDFWWSVVEAYVQPVPYPSYRRFSFQIIDVTGTGPLMLKFCKRVHYACIQRAVYFSSDSWRFQTHPMRISSFWVHAGTCTVFLIGRAWSFQGSKEKNIEFEIYVLRSTLQIFRLHWPDPVSRPVRRLYGKSEVSWWESFVKEVLANFCSRVRSPHANIWQTCAQHMYNNARQF